MKGLTQSDSRDSMPNNSPARGPMVAPIETVVETQTYNKGKKSVWYQPGQPVPGQWVSILFSLGSERTVV